MKLRSWRRVLPSLVVLLGLLATPHSLAANLSPTKVTIRQAPGGRYTYLVNGQEGVVIGMGYNPVYRSLPPAQRAANYRRDFSILCHAGVNTITGWDADKGYEQDKFDELTLDNAQQYGIGVVMPIYLPADGDYTDPELIGTLLRGAVAKVQRYKNHPSLRMWGVGNEVMMAMQPDVYPNFLQVYLNIIDLVHQIDPNHPVIYRESEDEFVPLLAQLLHDSGDPRPWFLYGMNIYDKDPGPLLRNWPNYGLNRPLFVTEFGAEGTSPSERAQGYVNMWRSIRSYPQFVMGGAPYAWTAAGPEPTDAKWGLMNASSVPVDETFRRLMQQWRAEPKANGPKCG